MLQVGRQLVKLKDRAKRKRQIRRDVTALRDAQFPYKSWWLPENFSRRLPEIDLPRAYDELVRGLDQNSIDTIDTILGRLHVLSKHKGQRKIDLFSAEEKAEFAKVRSAFFQRIVKLGDECFQYKTYRLPIEHFEESVLYYRHSMHEIADLERIREKSIIDVGGFIGDSALLFSEMTQKQVHSFEPNSENRRLLEKTIAMNGLSNVVPVPYGLGAEQGTSPMYGDGPASTFAKDAPFHAPERESATVTTLDHYVAEHGLEVGLIKVDIEGHEQAFLQGAMNTIKTQRPTMLLSIYHNPDDFFHIKPTIEKLDLGYTFKVVRPPMRFDFLVETLLFCEVRGLK